MGGAFFRDIHGCYFASLCGWRGQKQNLPGRGEASRLGLWENCKTLPFQTPNLTLSPAIHPCHPEAISEFQLHRYPQSFKKRLLQGGDGRLDPNTKTQDIWGPGSASLCGPWQQQLRSFCTTHHPARIDFTNQDELVPGWLVPGPPPTPGAFPLPAGAHRRSLTVNSWESSGACCLTHPSMYSETARLLGHTSAPSTNIRAFF